MKIAIPKERRASERRVAASVDTIKKYKALGAEVVVETGAGDGASIPDKAFADAGRRSLRMPHPPMPTPMSC